MTKTAQDVGPVVATVEVDAPRERVFELFTTPEHIVRWWPDAATFEPRLGGRVDLHFDGRGDVSGEVTRFEPPAAIAFTWVRGVAPDVTTHVEVSRDDLGEGRTRVELVHTGWEAVPDDQVAEWRAIHDARWRHFLGCLGDLAAGRRVDKTFG